MKQYLIFICSYHSMKCRNKQQKRVYEIIIEFIATSLTVQRTMSDVLLLTT